MSRPDRNRDAFWAASQWEPEDDGPQIAARQKQLPVDMVAGGRILSQEEVDAWWQEREESFPHLSGERSSKYGVLPKNPVPAPKGQWILDRLPMAEVDGPTAKVTDELKEETSSTGTTLYSGTSYEKKVILIHVNKLGFEYSDEAVASIGNDNNSKFTTVMTIHAQHHQTPHILVEYKVALRGVNVELFHCKIPFTAMTTKPDSKELSQAELQQYLQGKTNPVQVQGGAVRVQCQARTKGMHLRLNHKSKDSLTKYGHPNLVDLIFRVQKYYVPELQNFTFLVSRDWTGSGYWGHQLADLFTASRQDPLADFRALSTRSDVITEKTVNESLYSETRQLPAFSSFEDVRHQLTILSDGVVRESLRQNQIAVALGRHKLDVVVQDIGRWKVPVQTPGDTEATRPQSYLYLVSVLKTSDTKEFFDNRPPPGTPVTLEIDVRYVKAKQDIRGMTDEKADLIGNRMFHVLKDLEHMDLPDFTPGDDAKTKDEKTAARDDFYTRYRLDRTVQEMLPFVTRTFPGEPGIEALTKMRQKIANHFAQILGKCTRINREEEKEFDLSWKSRVIAHTRAFIRHL